MLTREEPQPLAYATPMPTSGMGSGGGARWIVLIVMLTCIACISVFALGADRGNGFWPAAFVCAFLCTMATAVSYLILRD